VVKAYATYKHQKFTVVSISLDNQSARAAWLKAVQDDGLTWPQVSDLRGFNTEVAQQYAISFIPQNYLLDPQGRIVAKNLKGEALPQKLAQMLSAN
jgi:alkyl hydroperoxide reductase subunit AhpC